MIYGLALRQRNRRIKGGRGGGGGSLMQFCCKPRGIMVLNRISPRKLWSDLDITVCNSCKTLEALPRKAIKVSPSIVGCGLSLHDASGTSGLKNSQLSISINMAAKNRSAGGIKPFCKHLHLCVQTYYHSSEKSVYSLF